MSDERVPTWLPSLTLEDLISTPDGWPYASLDDPLVYKQNTSTANLGISTESLVTTESSRMAHEDDAIRFLLGEGLDPEQLFQFVKTHKGLKQAEHQAALDTISGVRTEDLLDRIHTASRIRSCLPIPQCVSTSTTTPTAKVVPVLESLKRELPADVDEKPGPYFQDAKRTRMISMEREPEPQQIAEPRRFYRRGCPGNDWACEPEELGRRKAWTSFAKFLNHYRPHHLILANEHRSGNRFKCLLCDHATFTGEGHALVKHIWDNHFV